MKGEIDTKALNDFRIFLAKHTNCEIQEGWPCGTCVMALLDGMGLDSKEPEYSERNEKVDRMNEVWRAILQMRDKDVVYNRLMSEE